MLGKVALVSVAVIAGLMAVQQTRPAASPGLNANKPTFLMTKRWWCPSADELTAARAGAPNRCIATLVEFPVVVVERTGFVTPICRVRRLTPFNGGVMEGWVAENDLRN